MLFSFAFDPSPDILAHIAGGLLWLVFAFAGALIFNRGFARELPNECLDALLSSPLSSASLLIGKAFANLRHADGGRNGLARRLRHFLQRCVAAVLAGDLAGVFALGTWGVSIVGAVFGAMTVNLRLRELMLPVIIYPLMIPLLIGAIELTTCSYSTSQ